MSGVRRSDDTDGSRLLDELATAARAWRRGEDDGPFWDAFNKLKAYVHPVELALCEQQRIILKATTPYVFRVHPDCAECRRLHAVYAEQREQLEESLRGRPVTEVDLDALREMQAGAAPPR